MRHCVVDTRIRPVRFGLIVPANDYAAFDRAIATNTCLWGGLYNPIIPVPSQSDELSWSAFTLKQSLHCFEPDYLIDFSSAQCLDSFGIPIISIEDFWNDFYRPGIGANMLSTYLDAHESDFKYASTVQRLVYLPSGVDEFDRVVRVFCGGFNDEENYELTAMRYKKLFGAEKKIFSEQEFLLALPWRPQTPISMTKRNLSAKRPEWPAEAFYDMLFVLEPNNFENLISLWNLRALGWKVTPITLNMLSLETDSLCASIQGNWFQFLVPECNKTLVEKFVQDKSFSDDIHVSTIPELFDRFLGSPACRGAVSLETWTEECIVKTNSTISFRLKNLNRSVLHYGDHFMNVINVSLSPGENKLALPPTSADANAESLFLVGERRNSKQRIFQNSEGLIALEDSRTDVETWKLPTVHEIWRWYVSQRKPEAAVSFTGKGQIAENLLEIFGGANGLQCLKSARVLKLVDELAHGMRDFDVDDSLEIAGRQRKRTAYPKMITRRDWATSILQEDEANVWLPDATFAEKSLDTLLNTGAFRTGAKVKCNLCFRSSWYLIEQLAEILRCDHCLKEYQFPFQNPNESGRFNWCHRPQGPCSIENYAQGQYSILLTLSFLHLVLREPISWVIESLISSGERNHEIDLVAWNRTEVVSFWRYEPPTLLFGECKSFHDSVDNDDLERLSYLASMFPGSIFVVSTLAKKFNNRTKERLRKFSDKQKVKLIVLTAEELLRPYPLPTLFQSTVDPRVAEYSEKNLPPKITVDTLSERTTTLNLN